MMGVSTVRIGLREGRGMVLAGVAQQVAGNGLRFGDGGVLMAYVPTPEPKGQSRTFLWGRIRPVAVTSETVSSHLDFL